MELNFSDNQKVQVEDDIFNFFTSFLYTLRRTDTVTLEAIDHLVELFNTQPKRRQYRVLQFKFC